LKIVAPCLTKRLFSRRAAGGHLSANGDWHCANKNQTAALSLA
jgi:hypothetical protein